MNKILVIDDEPEIIAMLRRNLQVAGYNIDGAHDKDEAIELMNENNYPIVLLDVRFPKTSGVEMLNVLHEINPTCNIMMISGYSSKESVIDCLQHGAVNFFTKPLDIDNLIENIRNQEKKIDRWQKTLDTSARMN